MISENEDEGEHCSELYDDFIYEDDYELKYVITCFGISSGKRVYLQDKRKGGYWTQFIDNAREFDSYEEAKKLLKYFKFNKPKVIEKGTE